MTIIKPSDFKIEANEKKYRARRLRNGITIYHVDVYAAVYLKEDKFNCHLLQKEEVAIGCDALGETERSALGKARKEVLDLNNDVREYGKKFHGSSDLRKGWYRSLVKNAEEARKQLFMEKLSNN